MRHYARRVPMPPLDRFRLLTPTPDGPPIEEAAGTWDDVASVIGEVSARAGSFLVTRPGAITHHDLGAEIGAAITDPGLHEIRWLALVSDGWDIDGRRWDSGNYLDDPADPAPRPLRIAAHGEPAVILVHADTYRTSGVEARGTSYPEWVSSLLTAGHPVYLSHRVRFSAHEPLDTGAAPTGPRVESSLRHVRRDPTVSIVIRTTGDRPALLRRALSSAVAAGASEVIVASPRSAADPTEAAGMAPDVVVRHVSVPEMDLPGRTAALMAGLEAAETDYVWFVDDDDWAEPQSVDAIVGSIHAGDRPVIVGTVTSHEETWSGAELAHRRTIRTYVSDEWYRAFTGWNHVPNCALVYPTHQLRDRLATTGVRHDLGEDFALQLLAVTTPGTAVLAIEDVIANVSVRDHGTTVSMVDRTPWLRDLGSHVSSLLDDPHASGTALWRLGRSVREIPYPAPTDLRPPPPGDEPGEVTEAPRRRGLRRRRP